VVKRSAVIVLFVVATAFVVAACGGSPGSKALEASQKRAEQQEEKADEKNGGIEAASDTEGASDEAKPSGGMASEDAGASKDGGATLPASVTAATITAGKQLFTTTCGGCHTLKDAGTSGQVGPDLDQLKPGYDEVSKQVENGGGGMPAGLLSGDDLNAVAGYVATATGAAPAPKQ
jgi:mono/diheme cytochrome c family protein